MRSATAWARTSSIVPSTTSTPVPWTPPRPPKPALQLPTSNSSPTHSPAATTSPAIAVPSPPTPAPTTQACSISTSPSPAHGAAGNAPGSARSDTTRAPFEHFRAVFLRMGLPTALHADGLALFGHESTAEGRDLKSEFQRALTALGVSHLVAPSPRAQPGQFSWIGRAGSTCFRHSFVLRSLRASYRPAPRSLLGRSICLAVTSLPMEWMASAANESRASDGSRRPRQTRPGPVPWTPSSPPLVPLPDCLHPFSPRLFSHRLRSWHTQ